MVNVTCGHGGLDSGAVGFISWLLAGNVIMLIMVMRLVVILICMNALGAV